MAVSSPLHLWIFARDPLSPLISVSGLDYISFFSSVPPLIVPRIHTFSFPELYKSGDSPEKSCPYLCFLTSLQFFFGV